MRKVKVVLALSLVSLSLTGCGSYVAAGKPNAADAAHRSAKPYAGQTITVLFPYNAPPRKLLAQFTAQTGIKVNWTVLGFAATWAKIVSASSANTYFADLTDVDWSRVGQYYRTKWFIPLNKYFNVKSLRSDVPQLNDFMVNGQLVGMPIDASLMLTTVNVKDFARAGITRLPTTIAQYTTDLRTLQRKGIHAHPLGISFAAQEGLSTYWYEVTGAFGGSIFGPGYKPLFTSPSSAGYRAMQWMVNAYKSGLVPTSDINMVDYQVQQSQMALHRISSVMSDYSGNVGTLYNVPSQSKVVGQIKYIPTPGIKGIGPNLGNPDGMGIPVTAKHPGAAAVFLKWFTSPQMQADFSGLHGPADEILNFPLPMRLSSMNMLQKANKVTQVNEMIMLFRQHSRPVFPNGGPPPWYPQFSNAVYTNIHSAALGQESVAQAIQAISNTVNQLNH